MDSHTQPGSEGEHLMQERQGSVSRARAFYNKQVLDYLNSTMQQFLAGQEMFFLASADHRGECDCSFRAGEKGFVQVIDEHTLMYPEIRGNGVYASLGNVLENPHVGMLFVDFFEAGIGLHVNGKARICKREELQQRALLPPHCRATVEAGTGRPVEMWVVVEVMEAYIHCAKHIPHLVELPREIDWGTDDPRKKGGDYFHAKECHRPWSETANGPAAPVCRAGELAGEGPQTRSPVCGPSSEALEQASEADAPCPYFSSGRATAASSTMPSAPEV
jgi:predicted pyridoxine 5'-phosphate oxidase superfamily flavin-nucleotide-binding protein